MPPPTAKSSIRFFEDGFAPVELALNEESDSGGLFSRDLFLTHQLAPFL